MLNENFNIFILRKILLDIKKKFFREKGVIIDTKYTFVIGNIRM